MYSRTYFQSKLNCPLSSVYTKINSLSAKISVLSLERNEYIFLLLGTKGFFKNNIVDILKQEAHSWALWSWWNYENATSKTLNDIMKSFKVHWVEKSNQCNFQCYKLRCFITASDNAVAVNCNEQISINGSS